MRGRPLARAALLLVAAAGLLAPWGCGRGGGSNGGRVAYDADGYPVRLVERPRNLPNLVLVVIDTLRGDSLSLASDDEGTMPFLHALAGRGVAFADATAPAAWTLPSMTSLLTGLLPSGHGSDDMRNARRLPDAMTTFAEILGNAYGYQTAAFVGSNWFGWSTNMLQGFQVVRQGHALQGTGPMVGAWAERRDPTKPFFLLLHTFEAHDPYGARNHLWPDQPPNEAERVLPDAAAITDPAVWTRYFFLDAAARHELARAHGNAFVRGVVRYVHSGWRAAPDEVLAADLRTGYTDGVAWVDGRLRQAVEELRAMGLLDHTLLVVAADHGEAFGEHGILAHGRQLYDELIRVPLVIDGPAPFTGGRVLHGGVGFLDILPTFLDWAGLTLPTGIDGSSFLPLVEGRAEGRPVLSEERLHNGNTGEDNDAVRISVRSARWKYIVTYDVAAGTVTEELYDLVADPGEHADLAREGHLETGTVLDPGFCEAVERARDRIWGAASQGDRRAVTPYGAGVGRLHAERPAPCASGP